MMDVLSKYRGLYGIVDLAFEDKLSPERWTEIFVNEGVKIIQLRAKKVSSLHFFQVAESLRKLIPQEYLFIINDRPDIAVIVGADGVHLGQDDLPPRVVKEKWGFVTGFSTHNIGQVEKAAKLPVDYIGFGPIYPTTSKEKPDPVVGIDQLVKVVEISPHPVVAIGGINEERLKKILEKVCPEFFSVVSYIALSDKPEKVVRRLQEIYMENCGKAKEKT